MCHNIMQQALNYFETLRCFQKNKLPFVVAETVLTSQITEKRHEFNVETYLVFVDLGKAFDRDS